ncbi:MAG: FtsW/RodA/SpoVE family cell cycle protein [Holosporales bacterium]|nr:FtsW/RodA/SpoVE family cell cycle protein [Holosporales bacterium]
MLVVNYIMPRNSLADLVKRWFMSIDNISLFIITGLISIGIWVSIASTPSVAMKLDLPPFHFVKQHMIILLVSIIIMVFISFLQINYIKRLSVTGYFGCLVLVVLTIIIGSEIKGARRWLSFFGFSMQPSEFFKPILAVTNAWLITEQYRDRKFPGIVLSGASVSVAILFLLLQPDIGMIVVICSSWIGQLFISGMSTIMLGCFLFSAIGALFGLYFTVPHFANRIDRFIMSGGKENDIYQVQKSLEAFKSGGLFGKGPGEGVIKTMVPDSHSDFVFSVIAEEYGFIVCFVIIALFTIFIIRSMMRANKSSSIFSICATFGIVLQIGLQVLINTATSLNLIPTKGMTMPFISYGGSSFLSSSISIGILLAITKRQSIIHGDTYYTHFKHNRR